MSWARAALIALLGLVLASPAAAQTAGSFVSHQPLTAAALNAVLGSKMDYAASPAFTGLTLNGLAGSVQCLHVNIFGVVSGTGSDCGSGGGGGTPGGSSGQLEYNNGGVFGGLTMSGDATLNTSSGALTLANTSGARSDLGLLSAATVATGTSGGTLCLENTSCLWANQSIDGAAGTKRLQSFTTAGSTRFSFGADDTAESGSNAGSDFQFYRWSDAGAFLDVPMQIIRSSGVVSVTDGLIVGGGLTLNGSTSGTLALKCAATCGTNTVTFPAGTTNFSATGGTSQVVKQTSAGGAFTVARLACADLSDASTGCNGTGLSSKALTAWTPTLQFQTNGSSSFNYTTQSGHYACVNGVAYVDFQIVFTWTASGNSGYLEINNPPYNTAATDEGGGYLTKFEVTNAGSTQIGVGFPTASVIAFSSSSSTGAATPQWLIGSQFGGTTYLYGVMNYPTSSVGC